MHIFHSFKVFIFSTGVMEIMLRTNLIQAKTYILKVFGKNLQSIE